LKNTLLQTRVVKSAKGESVEGKSVKPLFAQKLAQLGAGKWIGLESKRRGRGEPKANAESILVNASRNEIAQRISQRQSDLGKPSLHASGILRGPQVHARRQAQAAAWV